MQYTFLDTNLHIKLDQIPRSRIKLDKDFQMAYTVYIFKPPLFDTNISNRFYLAFALSELTMFSFCLI